MTKEKGRAREQVAKLINQATPVVSEWVARRRRPDLAGFLETLARTGPSDVLADPHSARDAQAYLMVQWANTVTQVARPDTLPEVVRRREQVRVHPAAPATTAAVASGGTVAVLAADLAAPLEVFGVAGVVVATALTSAVAWKPRARAEDRAFTLTGGPALVARAQVELAGHDLAALSSGSESGGRSEAQLTRVVASSRQLEDLEHEAERLGLLDGVGVIQHEARTPAEQALMGELLARRTDLVHAVLTLGSLGHAERAQQRADERDGYGLGPG